MSARTLVAFGGSILVGAFGAAMLLFSDELGPVTELVAQLDCAVGALGIAAVLLLERRA